MGSFFNGGSRNKPRYERLPLETFYSTDTPNITKNNDQEEDNLLFDLGDLGQNGRLLPPAKNGYDSEEEIEFYKDTRNRRPAARQTRRNCRGTSRSCLLCLLVILVIVVIFFGAVYFVGPGNAVKFLNSGKGKTAWSSATLHYGTETAIRLYDVNLDGIQDVIMGAATTMSLKEATNQDEFCKSINMKSPCAGLIIALDGRNGSRLWTISTSVEVFEIQCGKLDMNGDGHLDCIGAGRMGTLQGFDPINGVSLWSADPEVTNPHFNFYQGQVVPDLNQDGVKDFVVTHGGDTRLSETDIHRPPGRLLLLSGKTGKSLGRYITLPEGHETYSSITLYQRQNGAVYLMFGSGGETVGGSLWMISLRDLYCYVMSISLCDAEHLSHMPALLVTGYEERWGSPLQTLPSGVMEVISGSSKGVTVPTEMVDMNNDGIDDVLVLLYNSTITLLDGRNLQVIWTTGNRFAQFETYSNPAPGYFNDDDTLDVMVRLSEGRWPVFKWTYVYILDGKNGEILWYLKTPGNSPIMSSPFTIQCYGHKDAFLFWVSGLHSKGSKTGSFLTGHGLGTAGGQGPTVHQERPRRHGDEYDEMNKPCEVDMALFHAELLLVDRDLAMTPLRLATIDAFKYNYTLTEKERQRLPEEPHGPVAMETASPDSHVTTPSHSSLKSTEAGVQESLTEEDLARHDLLRHTTEARGTETMTTLEGPGPTTDAVTTPEGAGPTTVAVSTQKPEVTTDAVTSPQGEWTTTDAVTTPQGELPTTDAVTTPQGELPTTDAVTTPQGELPTADAVTTPQGELPTADAVTTPQGERPTDAVTMSESAGSNFTNFTSETFSGNISTVDLDTSTVITAKSTSGMLETTTTRPTGNQSGTSTEEAMPLATANETTQHSTSLEVIREGTVTYTSEAMSTLDELTTDKVLQETTTKLSTDVLQTTEVGKSNTSLNGSNTTPQNSSLDATFPLPSKKNVEDSNQPTELTETQTVPDGMSTIDATSGQSSQNNTAPPRNSTTKELLPGSASQSIVMPSLQGNKPISKGEDMASKVSQMSTTVDAMGKEETRRKRREIPGGDLCTVFTPTLFGTGIIGDLDADGKLDYVYAENYMAAVRDEKGSFIVTKPRLSIHRLVIDSAIKRRDWVRLTKEQAMLSPDVQAAVVDREDIDDHFHFLPVEKQSWTSYMGKDVDGKFTKPNR